MKITKQELRKIIMEELENEIKSLNEVSYDPFDPDAIADKRADDERAAAAEKERAAAKKATDDEARAKREPLEKKRSELDILLSRTSRSLPPRVNRRDSKPGFFASREQKMAYERRQDGLKRMKAIEAAIAAIDKKLESL